jgi:hypothetical protein
MRAAGLSPFESLPERSEDLCALLVVGRVGVEEVRLASERLDPRADLLHVAHAGAPVQVHARDVVPVLGEGQSGCLTETAAGAQDQRPALAFVSHGVLLSHLGRGGV